MSIKWRSVLFHPLILGLVISTIVIFVLLKLLPHYKISVAESAEINNNGYVYFVDLNNDGKSEKINYYEYDSLFPPTLYLYNNDGSFISLFAFFDFPLTSVPLLLDDYDNNQYKEIFILNHKNDSLFLYGISLSNPKDFFISRMFLCLLPKDFTVMPVNMADINGDNYKELITLIRTESIPQKTEIIAFNLNEKRIEQKNDLKLYVTDFFIEDANNDEKPEFYFSNKTVGTNGSNINSALVVLDHTFNYLFNPIQFVGKPSEVKLSLIQYEQSNHIAVLHSGSNKQKSYAQIQLFDLKGVKLIEKQLDPEYNYSFIPNQLLKKKIQLFTGKLVYLLDEKLDYKKSIELGNDDFSFITVQDFNSNLRQDLVFKSSSDVIFLIDDFSEIIKIPIKGTTPVLFTVNYNNDKPNQLGLQIGNKWTLFDFLINKSYLRNYLFYFIVYIVLTFLVYTIMRFIFRRRQNKRITKFIESEEEQYKVINELEDKLGNKIAGLKQKIHDIKGNDGEQYENVINQIDDTYSQLKTISERISRENTRGIYIHDFFNHLSETFTANKVTITLYPNDEWFEISTDLQNHLYKLLDDSINHICDYIKNTNINISLTRHLNYVNCLIDIENEYIDLLKQKSDKINAIISRMLLLNGKYETDGSKGTGTLINYTVPLNSSFTDKKTDKKVKIIIAEDHDVSLFGLITLFKTKDDIEVIGTAKNGLEVLKILEEKNVDIIITDISMPGMDGIELSEKLKNDYPDIKVIVFTMYMENWFVEQLTKNGARGFVSKNSRISELVEAVRQVSKGNYFYCHQFKSKFGLNGANGYDSQKSMLDSLTSKELQIVEFIANNMKRKEIAAKLSVHQSTVDTYLANIMLKLNAGDEDEVGRIAKKQKFVSDLE